ncbi:MAG: tetratricopeptide repeat protein [Bacteroidales bacterium]|nr:tetratricopeptide repeat protein [Bacteroidales bacterium]
MKRIFLTLLSAFIVVSAFTQTSTQVNYKSLEKKINKSNSEIENEKKSSKYKTWLKRGELMLDVYEAMTLYANNGMTINEFELVVGSPKTKSVEEIEGEKTDRYSMERTDFFFMDQVLVYWTFTKPLYEDPLNESYRSFQKVVTLDDKNKAERKLKTLYEKLKNNYLIEGSIAYAKKDFAKSHDYFVKAIEIGEMPLVNFVDTTMIYYAGLSAQLNMDYEEAIKLYKKAIELGSYYDGNVYYNAFDAYNSMNRAEEGLPFLEEGFVKFSKNQNILYGLINYYISRQEDPEVVIEYIDQALKTDENSSLYFAKGTLLDNLGNLNGAVNAYNKSIDLNPEFFDAVYNLAALYFNQGVKFLEEANNVPAKEVEKYDALIDKSNVEFKKSIPYMERALELAPQNLETLGSLRNLYFRYRNEDEETMKKYEDINDKWNELKQQ